MSLAQLEFPPKYTFEKKLGSGGFGSVLRAYDSESGHLVAVKKIYLEQTNEVAAARVLRELKVIRLYTRLNPSGNNLNIVRYYESVLRKSLTKLSKFMVMIFQELMDCNLEDVIKDAFSEKLTLSYRDKSWMLLQILNGVNELHQLNILHRDLTPRNVLVNLDGLIVKISDFGLSRYYSTKFKKLKHTMAPLIRQSNEMVCTMVYRAPELLVFEYNNVMDGSVITKLIDIWCVGCIFFELLMGVSLADCDLLYLPDYLHGNYHAFIEYTHRYTPKFIHEMCITIKERCPEVGPLALDLLSQMLDLNPSKRISIERIEKHGFVKQLMKTFKMGFIKYRFSNFKALDKSFQFEEVDFNNTQHIILTTLLSMSDDKTLINKIDITEPPKMPRRAPPLARAPLAPVRPVMGTHYPSFTSQKSYSAVPVLPGMSRASLYRTPARPRNSKDDECIIC